MASPDTSALNIPPVTVAPDATPPRAGESGRDRTSSRPGAEQAAAALVELSGASPVTVANYEQGVPPNLAAAAALADELSSSGGLNAVEQAGVFTLLDRATVLALAAS